MYLCAVYKLPSVEWILSLCDLLFFCTLSSFGAKQRWEKNTSGADGCMNCEGFSCGVLAINTATIYSSDLISFIQMTLIFSWHTHQHTHYIVFGLFVFLNRMWFTFNFNRCYKWVSACSIQTKYTLRFYVTQWRRRRDQNQNKKCVNVLQLLTYM